MLRKIGGKEYEFLGTILRNFYCLSLPMFFFFFLGGGGGGGTMLHIFFFAYHYYYYYYFGGHDVVHFFLSSYFLDTMLCFFLPLSIFWGHVAACMFFFSFFSFFNRVEILKSIG
jgi:hypothetical protein